MITSTHQLAVTRQKLDHLRSCAQRLESKGPPANEATRLTFRTYRRLIHKLEDEIEQFETGAPAAVRARDTIQSEQEARRARRNMDELTTRCRELEQQPGSPERDADLLRLRRMHSRLVEEIAWFETRDTGSLTHDSTSP